MAYSRPLYLTSPQMYGSDVREMQQRLKDLGYNPGTIDGYFGQNSKNAIIAFQGKNNLSQDGSCGPATWNKLFSSSAVGNGGSGYTRPLYLTSPQMYGSDVTAVQNRLNALKYNCGTANGYFGPNTQSAVITFQGRNGLSQDGSCGPDTWNKLFSSSAVAYTFTKHGDVQYVYAIVTKNKVISKAREYDDLANGTNSTISDNIGLLSTILGCIPKTPTTIGLIGLGASLTSLVIGGTRSFYSSLRTKYIKAADDCGNNTHVMFKFPMVFTDRDYAGPQAPPHAATRGYWSPSLGYLSIIGYGTESSLRALAKNNGAEANGKL